ncbi:hypothetical protein C8J57DRAFT_1501320 [Mycena rebaudengoi]|nr:hypothetical protein C8J57DRAFT_1501320 [Mycena rebaudengoi]
MLKTMAHLRFELEAVVRFASFILDARIQQEMVISPPISESRSPLSLPLLMAEFQILEDQISHEE